MKKLMMAAAIVCAAAAAQAATVNWSENAALIRNGTGQNANVADGTAVYLLQYSAYTAESIVSGFVGGTLSASVIQSYKVLDTQIASGMFDSPDNTSSAFTALDAEKAYYVIFNGANMFVSEVIDAQYDSMGTTGGTYTFAFGDVKALSKQLPVSTDYAGAHWYTAAVPEPTSGLLLLLGVAGLALRRRRA